MSPPIYTPDGSEVSEIVLPDGSTASKVIGPDGNVVFEAGPDIPDSVTNRWKVDEGSGGTIFDSRGSVDGTINGASWVSDSTRTGWHLAFDPASNNYVDFGNVLDVNAQDFTLIIFFRTTQSGDGPVRLADKRGQGGFGDGFPSYQLSPDTTDGVWVNTAIEDNSGNVAGGDEGSFETFDFNENDGEWHMAALRWENDSGAATLAIDGTTRTVTDTNTSMIDADLATSRNHNWGRANTDAQYFEGDINEGMFALGAAIPDSTLDDIWDDFQSALQ